MRERVTIVEKEQKNKQRILIADDSEMNRSILMDMLEDAYEIIEAENGNEAVRILSQRASDIDLLLLDIVMPEMDGFGVLEIMNQNKWIEDIPVIMISAESAPDNIERAYNLGVTDFISRPFDALIVHRRVVNTILLYAKQKKLIGLVADQVYEKEQQSNLMIDILSHIVEFRNGESGLHVPHVRILTELLLREISRRSEQYNFSRAEISIIGTASALHDIGKISIAEEVLNKPGRLTDEEYEIMKTHSIIGANMLKDLPIHQNEPLVKTAYEICRWHHERYDGRGYPDGLKGDDIPISAQIVSLADVYDALTSERVYKKAFSHETAIEMITQGQCGSFNPMLLSCLLDIADTIPEEMSKASYRISRGDLQNVAEEMLKHEELSASDRTLRLLEHERMKYSFFASLTEEIQFEYTLSPPMISLSSWGARKLGLPEIIMDPMNDPASSSVLNIKDVHAFSAELRSTTPERPVVEHECKLSVDGKERWYRIIGRATWSDDEPPRYLGSIGKAMDIHEERVKMSNLEHVASHDMLTGLLNHAYAKKQIHDRIKSRPQGKFALTILDMDRFKDANDNYGHMFGDRVLEYMADKLRASVRGGDIVARVGGDEFLIFMEYKEDVEHALERVFRQLAGQYEDFKISVSMGAALTEEVGTDYDVLFHSADQALYSAKQAGRGRLHFYDESVNGVLTELSPIDSDEPEENRH